jgi:hypothetical protein
VVLTISQVKKIGSARVDDAQTDNMSTWRLV